MSMIAYLQAISPHLVTAIQTNPELLLSLLDPAAALSPEQRELAATATAALEIGKNWHGIHYLLTGEAWESPGVLGKVILGGTEIGEDLGYGPARLLTPAEVVEVTHALQNFPPSEFQAAFNPEKLNGADIYPDGWTTADQDSLVTSYTEVSNYYQSAANQGLGMLLYLL